MQSGVGLLPAEGGCRERRIRRRHPEPGPRGIRRGVSDGLLARSDAGGRIDGNGALLGPRSP